MATKLLLLQGLGRGFLNYWEGREHLQLWRRVVRQILWTRSWIPLGVYAPTLSYTHTLSKASLATLGVQLRLQQCSAVSPGLERMSTAWSSRALSPILARKQQVALRRYWKSSLARIWL